MLWHKSHKNDTGEHLFGEIIFRCELSSIIILSVATLCSCVEGMSSAEIQFENTIPSVTSGHLKFHYQNLISSWVIHNKIWQVSEGLYLRKITMLWSDTSPDVNTPEIRCLKPNTIALLRKAMRQTQLVSLVWNTGLNCWHPLLY